MRAGLTVTVILRATAAVLSLAAAWAPADVTSATVEIVAGGWLAEYLGVTTGFLFGSYSYTRRLTPQYVPRAGLPVAPGRPLPVSRTC